MTSTRLLFTSGSALLIASWADLISGRRIENPAEMIILSAFLIVPVGLLMLSIETLRATILGAIYLFLSVIGSFASAYRIYGTHATGDTDFRDPMRSTWRWEPSLQRARTASWRRQTSHAVLLTLQTLVDVVASLFIFVLVGSRLVG